MAEYMLCENCNALKARCVIVLSTESDGSARSALNFCPPCYQAVLVWDLSTLVSRHNDRPRSLELP